MIQTERDEPAGSRHMKISVVIPTLKRQAMLCQLLGDLSRQTVLPDEVLVVDQSPPTREELDEQRAAAGSLRLIRCVCPQPAGTSGARNIGLSHARGDFVLMLDDDHHLEADVIESFTVVMAEGMDVVKGDIIENGLRWHERHANSPGFDSPGSSLSNVFDYLLRGRYGERQQATIGLNSGFTMYRREALERIDGFDGRFRGWFDDFDTGLRLWLAGARMCHDPRPVAVHFESDEGGRRSFDEGLYMHRAAARWAFMIQHFGEQSTREDYIASVVRTISEVVRRKVSLRRLQSIPQLTRSWKRARVIAATAPQMLSSPLPEHQVIEEGALSRAYLRKASQKPEANLTKTNQPAPDLMDRAKALSFASHSRLASTK